jgi:hypothetical protein
MVSATATADAAAFAEAQGYLPPLAGVEEQLSDPIAKTYLLSGSSANSTLSREDLTTGAMLLSDEFWSRNYSWIDARWQAWRAKP